MHTFNGGKPYHGSEDVTGGKLRGQTDSDYFYFLCPHCADNTVLQILDFTVREDGPVRYAPENRPKAKRDFTIVLKLWCRTCHLEDFVKAGRAGRAPTSFVLRLGFIRIIQGHTISVLPAQCAKNPARMLRSETRI